MKRLLLLLPVLMMIRAAAQQKKFSELYRPQFHFTPARNWTNDPNGLIYYRGLYHLFYQNNPFANVWGHMTWGHAVSKDLIHWKHLPIAIPEANSTMIFSGSAVIDEKNSSGFSQNPALVPMVAIYTGHFIADSTQPDDYLQSQNIAYSLNGGNSWIKYAHNPVLDLHKKDFRDPCVFWYAPQKKWVMAVVLPVEHIVQFYASPNLINWTHLSDFGPAGDTSGVWECPDLVQVPVEGSTEKKWVLFNSEQLTMQYFVGSFDGTTFSNENPAQQIYRPDYGPDYYAAITYHHLPAVHRPVLLGWANNWSYANHIPTSPWRGMMAIPRELSLKKTGDEWILYQKPVAALYGLRGEAWQAGGWTVIKAKKLPVHSRQCEIELSWKPAPNTVSGIELAVKENKKLIIGYDAVNGNVFMDRQQAGDTGFDPHFTHPSKYAVRLPLPEQKLQLHIFFDNSVVEVFANDGRIVMTMQIFPSKQEDGMMLYSDGGQNIFDSINIRKMRSAW